MKCIIIEDESHAAYHLKTLLEEIAPEVEIATILDTVSDCIAWLEQHSCDLIFLDIHLGDDSSFSIFDKISADAFIIFTTAHHEYALDAFKLNSVDYILKPIQENDLRNALSKYYRLTTQLNRTQIAGPQKDYQTRFVVKYADNMKTLTIDEIAYFFVQQRYLFIVATNGTKYLLSGNMDSLEPTLDPKTFFRINRQFIVSFPAIEKMQTLSRGRIKVHTTPPSKTDMIVSTKRANLFKQWVTGRNAKHFTS
jgi:DNA-binding LytR/AlgR family response regulator